jgi:formyltetrahydrofolate-dependent phosphoribosylglycinamide formyltransferase
MTARLAVLASGNGSNLQALLDACGDGTLPARVWLVASNNPNAFALERARLAHCPLLVAPSKPFLQRGGTRETYDAHLARAVATHRPDLVVLAGWMLVLGRGFLEAFVDRVVNLHPALPGQFPGKDAIRRAWEAGQRGEVREAGVMVHRVVPEIDAGPVIAQEVVPLVPGEALAELEARMHAVEHRLLVRAVGEELRRLDR